ncbi:Malic enzyme [Apophysomyces sp. BC1015]|nr:Malic enzyme [Apophysomyces sp. BC1015]
MLTTIRAKLPSLVVQGRRPTAVLAQRTFSYSSDPRRDKTVHVTQSKGVNVLHDPLLSKGTAFSIDERERLSIRGLVPPRCQEMDKQLLRIKRNLDYCDSPLAKFIFLTALQDRNETLFYKLIMEHMEEYAGIIYTPTALAISVGLASQKSHSIYRRSRGMYFSAQDRGNMSAMVYNWPHDDVDVIVVTDGSRVLGLGDLGANGMQIPIGKLSLYVAAGGIRPRAVLPVVLDVGTNNEALLNDPLYLGMGHPRLEGDEYYSLVDEWVTAITSRWPNRNRVTCFNDDIQSTSAITLAGILASLKARGLQQENLSDERIVCVGAGSAGVGVCEGIIDCMVTQGRVKSREEAYKKIWMLDQDGLLGNSSLIANGSTGSVKQPVRANQLDERQLCYVKSDMPDRLSLEQVIEQIKPTVLLGLTGIHGVFSEKAIRTMAQFQERPVIFPLSNPDSHAECTAEEAFRWTEGRTIFASGSPFKDVVLPNNKVGRTNQCNNSYSFPGLGLGITVSRAKRVTSAMFLETARTIADMATPAQLREGILFPGVNQLRQVALNVGTRVCEVAYEEGVATAKIPEGETIGDVVRNSMYYPEYVPLVHHPYY